MKIAIASGKGGTGKTTVATALALSAVQLPEFKKRVMLADCDVEEPNAHIFMSEESEEITGQEQYGSPSPNHIQWHEQEDIFATVPEVIEERCNYCGECRDICQFNAITVLGQTILVFPEMCHSCLGCFRVCEQNALQHGKRLLGQISKTHVNGIDLVQGELRVGEAMASPLIKAIKKRLPNDDTLVIIDAPPGTSCPVINTLTGTDYAILVTEPTPFGYHDLKLCAEVIKILSIPFGVIINRAGSGYKEVYEWCRKEGIDVLLEIPFDRGVAEAYAAGIPLIQARPDLQGHFSNILKNIVQSMEHLNA